MNAKRGQLAGLGVLFLFVVLNMSGCAVVQLRASGSYAQPTGSIRDIEGYSTVGSTSKPLKASEVMEPVFSPGFGASAFFSPHIRSDFDFRHYSLQVRPDYEAALRGGKPEVINFQFGLTYSPIRYDQPIVPFVTFNWLKIDMWHTNYAPPNERSNSISGSASYSLALGADLKVKNSNNRSFWSIQPAVEIPTFNSLDDRVYLRLSVGYTFIAWGYTRNKK